MAKNFDICFNFREKTFIKNEFKIFNWIKYLKV